jgi:2C-methyl-D-erythritol 2,4-cyclodiphosphate synthase
MVGISGWEENSRDDSGDLLFNAAFDALEGTEKKKDGETLKQTGRSLWNKAASSLGFFIPF